MRRDDRLHHGAFLYSRLNFRRRSSSSSGCPLPSVLFRSEEHTSELQSRFDLVCRLLLEKKNNLYHNVTHIQLSSTLCSFMLPRPPSSILFPYTTLFRSQTVIQIMTTECSMQKCAGMIDFITAHFFIPD